MADVRALLRAEKASRAPKQAKSIEATGKKRKASEDEDHVRKRTKSDEEDAGPALATSEHETVDDNLELPVATDQDVEAKTSPEEAITTSNGEKTPAEAFNEDEWDAFERDIAEIPAELPQQPVTSILTANATISAAPMTSAEIEAQKKKEQQRAQRLRREEEIEGDKEDAARTLEDEFDQMDALEQRVSKMKEMREKLRQASGEDVGAPQSRPQTEGKVNEVIQNGGDISDESDDDEDEDDEDLRVWGFGRS